MPRVPFTPEQIQRLLATAKGDMFGLVLLGAFTGQRLMDIATLSWRKIDLEAGVIRFNQSKGDKDLPMPIHPQVAEFLLTRAGDNPDAPLLPELAGQRGSGSSGLSLRRRTMVAFHKEFHGSPTITAEITFRNKIF